VREAFHRSGLPYATTALTTVEQTIDGWAHAWATMRVDACAAARVRGDETAEVYELRSSCLGAELAQLQSLTDLLSAADAKLVERSVQSAQSLPSIELCGDVPALQAAALPRDPETRRRVDAVRQNLAAVSGLGMAARYDQAIAMARRVVQQAVEAHDARVQAEAQLELGQLLDEHGDYAEATEASHQALAAALEARADQTAARAAIDLTRTIGARQSRFADGDGWAVIAEAMAKRVHRSDALWGLYYSSRSLLRNAEARYDDALADALRALDIERRVFGEDHYSVAEAYCSLGHIQLYRAHHEEAFEAYRHCQAIQQRTLGPEHPALISTMIGIADVYGDSGQHERAIAEYRRALGILERVQPGHPYLASVYNGLGTEVAALGKTQEAFDYVARALAAQRRHNGPSDGDIVELNNLGELKLEMNDAATAMRYFDEALALAERVHNGRMVAMTVGNEGEALLKLNRPAEALAYCERAVREYERALDPKHPLLAVPLWRMGTIELGRHAWTRARVPLERALAIREAQPADGLELADIRFSLAQALWPSGERDRAVDLATRARDAYARAGATRSEELGETTAWMARHHAETSSNRR
jgi:serine/threonine-protein kinase